MRICNRKCADTSWKRLVKVTVGGVCPILFVLVAGMLYAAHLREKDQVYQDPYANPNEKIGQHVSEKVEPAEQHGGRFSVQSYEFTGKGPAHKMSDVRKYDDERLEEGEAAEKSKWPLDLTSDEVSMFVSK